MYQIFATKEKITQKTKFVSNFLFIADFLVSLLLPLLNTKVFSSINQHFKTVFYQLSFKTKIKKSFVIIYFFLFSRQCSGTLYFIEFVMSSIYIRPKLYCNIFFTQSINRKEEVYIFLRHPNLNFRLSFLADKR